MSLLRARESEAFVARSSRGVIRAASRLGCQEPVWAVSGHGEGEGMVKSLCWYSTAGECLPYWCAFYLSEADPLGARRRRRHVMVLPD